VLSLAQPPPQLAGLPVVFPIPAHGWVQRIAMPHWPADLAAHVSPPGVTNQCVAGVLTTWASYGSLPVRLRRGVVVDARSAGLQWSGGLVACGAVRSHRSHVIHVPARLRIVVTLVGNQPIGTPSSCMTAFTYGCGAAGTAIGGTASGKSWLCVPSASSHTSVTSTPKWWVTVTLNPAPVL
jgi:hypothetical protein